MATGEGAPEGWGGLEGLVWGLGRRQGWRLAAGAGLPVWWSGLAWLIAKRWEGSGAQAERTAGKGSRGPQSTVRASGVVTGASCRGGRTGLHGTAAWI